MESASKNFQSKFRNLVGKIHTAGKALEYYNSLQLGLLKPLLSRSLE